MPTTEKAHKNATYIIIVDILFLHAHSKCFKPNSIAVRIPQTVISETEDLNVAKHIWK